RGRVPRGGGGGARWPERARDRRGGAACRREICHPPGRSLFQWQHYRGRRRGPRHEGGSTTMKTIELTAGTSTSIGSLPHADPHEAAALVLERQPRLPAAPSLPNRSGVERMIAQAAWGIPGVEVLADGSL